VGNWSDATMGTPLHDACQPVAAAHGLDPALLEAVALVESGGRPDALRYEDLFYRTYIKDHPGTAAFTFGPFAACSCGPMQIMLEVACELGFTGMPWDLCTFEQGLPYGAKYLKSLLDWAEGDVDKALAAFNSGKGNAEKGPPYLDGAYISRVKAALKTL
jgi:soluble lytic murein transglycosylase-like protein